MVRSRSFDISLSAVVWIASLLLCPALVLAQGQTGSTEPKVADYLKSLAPATAGPGLVVGEPVGPRSDTSTADFGAACSYWLQIMCAGEGAFGQTPLWVEIHDTTRRVLHRANRQYSAADIPAVARSLGATDIAVSEIARKGGGYALSYRLFTSAGKPVGAPLVATGSKDAILAALPSLAQKMAAALGVTDTSGIPKSIDASPADMAAIGSCLRDYSAQLSDTTLDRLKAIAPRSPLAGLLLIDHGDYDAAVIDPLIADAAGNALILAEIRSDLWASQSAIDTAVADALKTYPHNYALNAAAMNTAYFSRDWAGQRQDAEDAVRSAPRNPHAWTGVGFALSYQAEGVRHGRTILQMSQQELSYVSDLYPLEEAADRRATEIEPDDAQPYYDLAGSAIFNGDMNVAYSAYWKSLHLDPDRAGTYLSGLQMFQPKWGGDPNMLRKVARLAAQRPEVFLKTYPEIISALLTIPPDPFLKQMEAKAFAVYIRQLPADNPSGKIAAAIRSAQAHPTFANWNAAAKAIFTEMAGLQEERPLADADLDWSTDCACAAVYAEQQALAKRPTDAAAWGLLSQDEAFAFGGQIAGTALVNALVYGPTNFDTFAWGLQICQPRWGGDTATALVIVEKAALSPDFFQKMSPFILNALSSVSNDDQTPDQSALLKKLTAQAQDAFAKLVAANPQDPKVQHEFATYYDECGQSDKAGAAYQAWASLDPNEASPHDLYGLFLLRQGNSSGALAQFQKAEAIDPNDLVSLYNAGTVLIGNSQYSQAQALLTRLVRTQPLHAAGFYQLGMALFKRGKIAPARADWRRAVALDYHNLEHGGDAQHMIDSTAPAPAASAS